MVSTWPRSAHLQTDSKANVFLLAFASGAVNTDKPVTMERYGIPGESALASVRVEAVPRDMSPEWFDNWKRDAVRALAAMQLGADLDRLDAARSLHMVRVEVPDPPDLAYLQGAWGLARWLVDCGADLVFDVHAARFRTREELLAFDAERPFDVQQETSIIFETEPRGGDRYHVMHTRGMIKFARPDVLLLVSPRSKAEDGSVITGIAEGLAAGRILQHGQRVHTERRSFIARAYRPAPQDDVNLNNEGILLESA